MYYVLSTTYYYVLLRFTTYYYYYYVLRTTYYVLRTTYYVLRTTYYVLRTTTTTTNNNNNNNAEVRTPLPSWTWRTSFLQTWGGMRPFLLRARRAMRDEGETFVSIPPNHNWHPGCACSVKTIDTHLLDTEQHGTNPGWSLDSK